MVGLACFFGWSLVGKFAATDPGGAAADGL